MSRPEEDPIPVDQNIVECIKDEYHKQLGLRPHENPQLDTAAEKAARNCELLKCDPTIYVAAQIKFWIPVKNSKQFFPSQLAGQNAIDNVHKYRSVVHRGNSWPGLYAQQKRYLGLAIRNTSRTIEEILLDTSIDLCAWFRCLVTKQPIPSVIKKWGQEAYEELKDPELKAFLDGLSLVDGVTFDYSRIPEFQ